jgi:hypothetical protein
LNASVGRNYLSAPNPVNEQALGRGGGTRSARTGRLIALPYSELRSDILESVVRLAPSLFEAAGVSNSPGSFYAA